MKTKPIDEILPLNTDNHLQEVLDLYSDLIDESINFGTHILKWDVENHIEKKDDGIISLFLRNCIELGDGISILIRQSSIDPGTILLRTLFENSLGILYLLEKNEEQRLYSFMVWRIKKDIKYYKQFISSYPSNAELKSKLKKDKLQLSLDKFFDREEIKNIIERKVEFLNKPKFKQISLEYEKCSKKRNNPNWYSLFDGPRNIKELSYYFGKIVEYEFQYRKYSENVHATGLMKGFASAGEGKAQIIQIRDFENCKNLYIATVSYLLMSFNEIIVKRNIEKRSEFLKWHSNFRLIHNKTIKEKQFRYKK